MSFIVARYKLEINLKPMKIRTIFVYYFVFFALLIGIRRINGTSAGDINFQLIDAVENGQTEKIRTLLKDGANVNAKTNNDETVLLMAAKKGRKEIVRDLISAGADINVKDENGRTVITYALEWENNFEIIQYLIEKGADINAIANNGANVINYASVHERWREKWDKKIFELIISKGADIYLKDNFGNSAYDYIKDREDSNEIIISAQKNLNSKEDFLFKYVTEGDLPEIRKLIAEGININLKRNGWTPLLMAFQEKHYEIVKELLNGSTDINVKPNQGGSQIRMEGTKIQGKTPLIYALEQDRPELVKELLSRGADVNLKTDIGKTPLMYACEKGYPEIVNILLEKGADINAVLQEHIMYVCTAGELKGWNALMYASRKGNLEIVKLLISKGANVNARTDIGWTSLMSAAFYNNAIIVDELINSGADIEAKLSDNTMLEHYIFKEGFDALDIAQKDENKNIQIINSLKKHKNK